MPFKASEISLECFQKTPCRSGASPSHGPSRPQEAPAGVTLDRMLRETEKVYEEVVGDGG